MYPVYRAALVMLALPGVILPALAEERREAAAHRHGQADIVIAQEGADVQIGLTLPAADALGFERAPRSAEENGRVLDLQQRLESLSTVVQSPVLEACAVSAPKMTLPFDTADPHDAHEHAEEHSHHSSDSGHEHEHELEHEHDHEKDGQSSHADISVQYSLSCPQALPAKLPMRLALFTQFPSLEQVNLQWLTEAGQGALQVEADDLSVVVPVRP